LDRVDQSLRKGLVIGIWPLGLSYDFHDVIAELNKVRQDALLTDKSFAILLTFKSNIAVLLLFLNLESGLCGIVLFRNDGGKELLEVKLSL